MKILQLIGSVFKSIENLAKSVVDMFKSIDDLLKSIYAIIGAVTALIALIALLINGGGSGGSIIRWPPWPTPIPTPSVEPPPTPSVAPLSSPIPNAPRGWDGTDYKYVHFGHYQADTGTVASILWRVLYADDSKALLLSEKILDCRSFDSNGTTWMNSGIYNWLNGEFFNEAFSAEEQSSILAIDSEHGHVFLLGRMDYLKPEYGFSSDFDANKARMAFGSLYAINNGLWVSPENGTSSYYTSTPTSSDRVAQIRGDGSIGTAEYHRKNVGIRPAIWIDKTQIILNSGKGTKESPYEKK